MVHFCLLEIHLGTDGKDRHGFKIEKTGPKFLKIKAMSAKITKRLLRYYCFLMKFVRYPLHNSTRAFYVCVKVLSNDFSTELT